MKKDRGVRYPLTFLKRVCDRRFLGLLDGAGVGGAEAKLVLYGMWADWATDGRAWRSAAEGEDSIIESFCEWAGERGTLVPLALKAGFMLESSDHGEEGESHWSLVDYQANNDDELAVSRHSLGATKTSLLRNHKNSVREADDLMELWRRRGTAQVVGISSSETTEALALGGNICRCIGEGVPTEGEWGNGSDGGFLAECVGLLREWSPEDRELVLQYLIRRKRDPEFLLRRKDLVVRDFGKLLGEAKIHFAK